MALLAPQYPPSSTMRAPRSSSPSKAGHVRRMRHEKCVCTFCCSMLSYAKPSPDLKTGVTPSASGSAYLEIETSATPGVSGLKLSCSVHGPRSLPRSAPFSPHIVLSTHVKYAPFATKQRRGYLRD